MSFTQHPDCSKTVPCSASPRPSPRCLTFSFFGMGMFHVCASLCLNLKFVFVQRSSPPVDQVHVEQGQRQPAEFPEQLLVICDIVRGVAFHPQVVNLFFATNTILHFDQALLKCDGSNGADVLRDRSQPTLGRNKRIFLVLDFSESSKLHCKRHFVSFIKAFWSVQQVLFRADNAH